MGDMADKALDEMMDDAEEFDRACEDQSTTLPVNEDGEPIENPFDEDDREET